MKRRLRVLLIPGLLLLAALACNMPGATPQPDLAQVVAQTQTAAAANTAATVTAGAAAPLTPAITPAVTNAGAPQPSQPPSGVQPTPGQPAQTLPPTQAAGAPLPTQPANCTNLARFVTESVPDGSQYPPGSQFVKTWTLQNVGTCTWTTEYALVFASGEQMGGTSPQPLGSNVAPNSTIQIYLPQTAPAVPGDYQGNWMLKEPGGRTFGLGSDGSKPFFIKIRVNPGAVAPTSPAPASSAALGSPTRSWSFNDGKAPFWLGDDGDTLFEIKDNRLAVTAFKANGDLWRVAERAAVDNFAIEARFQTGAACSGRDGYGLLVRAPSQPDSVIDTGYVLAFNCDGQFRTYRMDNGAWTGITAWSQHPAIKPGPNQENVMTVIGQGDKLQLYANGTLLLDFSDGTYTSGLFGLMIGSGGTQNFKITLQQLSLWDLP
ncbi:MAG: NBR1-Ig-like domain-containing protein [Chloroflexota bacterium]